MQNQRMEVMMKKRLFLILCLFALALSLAACSSPPPAPTLTPEPTSEPAETEAPAATPEPTPPAQETPDPYLLYWELIDKVTKGLRDGWTETKPADLGISDAFARPGAEELGWLMRDLNGDGVDELLFGRSREGDELTPTFDIFCLLGGTLTHPATGWEYNCWYLLPDGMLVNEWSNDGYDHYHSPYGYFNGSLLPGFNSAGRDQYLKLEFQRFTEGET